MMQEIDLSGSIGFVCGLQIFEREGEGEQENLSIEECTSINKLFINASMYLLCTEIQFFI